MNNDLSIIFSDSEFIILESATRILNGYINSLQIETKEKYKRVVMIKELARKKLKSTIIDDNTMSGLIKEINEIYVKKPKDDPSVGRTFKNLILEDTIVCDNEEIKHNYIYNSSIIYVDSIKDMKQISNSVYRSLRINEENNNRNNANNYNQSNNLHKHSMFSNAVDKPKMFYNHFCLVKHFLLTNSDYKTKFQKNAQGMEISTLDCLQGRSEEVIVLGMLMVNEEGSIQLQDVTKIINVDISECDWGKGYFTQGCVVLCQGHFKNDSLKAKAIVHPPHAWNISQFKEKFENDFFGAITKAFKSEKTNENITGYTGYFCNTISNTNRQEENYLLNFLNRDLSNLRNLLPKLYESHINQNLETIIKSNYNRSIVEKLVQSTNELLLEEFFVIISNPDLNNSNVLLAIDKIISGYNSSNNNTPFMIIFIGNFTSENSFSSFKSYPIIFDNLANIILKYNQIVKNTYITFIPGPDDFSLFTGFPRPSIIESVINPIKKKLPNIISATNPCRFSFFGKEVVIFRDNLNKKLARNSIVKCGDINKNKDFFIHTILSQGNLSPFDLNVTSKIWHLSQSMTILPLPDILILADVVEDFYITNKISTILNPGNFTKDYSFNIIYPLKNIVEPCKINI